MAHKPKKVLENKQVIVYDDFLPEDVYEKLYNYALCCDYDYINVGKKVSRVWRMRDGFPLRSSRNLFYYADQATRPNENWAYPSDMDLNLFADAIMGIMPEVQHFIGKPKENWAKFSVTSWIYPMHTGLGLHDDGVNYSGAYAFFLNPIWNIHWGGLLMVLDEATNNHMHDFKKKNNALQYVRKKWSDESDESRLIWESSGFAQCVLPKRNRIAFIANDAYHVVTTVTESAGDNVRRSFAGFFDKKL